MKHYLYLFFAALLFSCDSQSVFENNIDIESANWNKKDTLVFDFEIEDPNQVYNLLYNVRYSNAYPFYNLFTKYWIYNSSGSVLKTITVPEDMYLFDVKTGVPNGSGLGDIYDQRVSFLKNYKFPAKGKYIIKVVQYMRDEPLQGVSSFGVRVEKVQAEVK